MTSSVSSHSTTRRTRRWAARGAGLALAATVLTGLGVANAGSASAMGSTCTPPGQRPSGPITLLLRPVIGDPGYNDGIIPLPEAIFAVTGTLDAVVCPFLP